MISHGKMPRKEIRKNRYKIKCLVCTPSVEMDFDHRSKHNSRFHQDMLKSRKHIRYEVVGAPRNPFEAAAKRTREAEETNACVTQNPSNRQESADCAETGISDDHKNDQCLPTVIEKQFVPEMHRNENLTAGKRPRLDLENQFDELESQRSEEFDRNVPSDSDALYESAVLESKCFEEGPSMQMVSNKH